jgi:hypothetical protein
MFDINQALIQEVQELSRLIEYVFSTMQHQYDHEKNDVSVFF